MATNAVAAVEQTRLSKSDHILLAQYAQETSSDGCSGCERLYSEVLPKGYQLRMSCAASCTFIPTRITGWHDPLSRVCRLGQKSF
jgi:hypothetical protein